MCDNSKCSSIGDDCCAPGDESASCYDGFSPVRAVNSESTHPASCLGYDNGLYTCCSSGDVTAETLDDIGFDWCEFMTASCLGYDNGPYTCCSSGDVTLSYSYETTNTCREWGHPAEGAWNVDDDCCAGEKQAACETGYRYVKTDSSCYEECDAYYYYCEECTDESCDSNYDIYQEDGKDYDCGDSSIIWLIIGILVPCCCSIGLSVLLLYRHATRPIHSGVVVSQAGAIETF